MIEPDKIRRNVAGSVRARLLNQARAEKLDFNLLLQNSQGVSQGVEDGSSSSSASFTRPGPRHGPVDGVRVVAEAGVGQVQ